MVKEYYFAKEVNHKTWIDFALKESRGCLEKYYTKILGYGWKDKFVVNHDGKVFYIDESGYSHCGTSFEINDKRIYVFETEGVYVTL